SAVAFAQEEPLRADERTLHFASAGRRGTGWGAAELAEASRGAWQVFPHSRIIAAAAVAGLVGFVAATDAGQLQQLGGVECPSAADDGAAVFATIAVLHSDCAYSLEQDPVYQRARSDCEVLPA